MVDIKSLVSKMLGVGESRVRISPEALERIEEVSTRADVRRLIKEGLIEVEPKIGVSRGRVRARHLKRKRGRGRGPGSRKGSRCARRGPKRAWVLRIRAIRRFLKYLKDHGVIDARTWRNLYAMAKGGYFRDLGHLKHYLVTNNIVPQDKIRM